jgi:serine O-acetyltransferase
VSARAAWRADRARYGPRAWAREQSLWAVAVLRLGHRVDELPAGLGRAVATKLYWLLYRSVETLTGIGLTKGVAVGPGLRIHHFGAIFVADGVRIGSNCTLRQGVTIGERVLDGPLPVLGDDVELGAFAQILGGVTIGAGARIGAMSLVLVDVPAGATAVGVPARVIDAS